MEKTRDLSFDSFRGIAIIAVVAIHAIYLGGSPLIAGFLYYRQFLNFSVPALFFMSGYWASKGTIQSWRDYRVFLLKKLYRIFCPYLFWSFVLLACSAVKTGEINGYNVVFRLLTGGACMGYYFIIALAQLYVLTPLLQYINRRFKIYGLMIVVAFNLAAMLVIYLSRLLRVIGHIPAALPFYSWVVYYEMGLFMANRHSEVNLRGKMPLYVLSAVVLSFFVSVVEVMVILAMNVNHSFATYTVKYSSLLYSVCVIFAFLVNREYFRHLPKLVSTMGRYSFGIYLIHVIILGWIVKIFGKVDATSSFQPLYQLVLVVVTLSICLFLIGTARKLLPQLFCSRVLGF